MGATKALVPKRMDYGATWEMYLKEEPNSIDALFMGSSLAYCDIVPAVLYQESGISAYVMAGPEQPMSTTYYYLRECCKTQSPGTVFIECTSFFFMSSEEGNSNFKPNLTYMPWSMNRIKPVLDCTDGETLKELLFPLYAYHGRWMDFKLSDLKSQEADPLAGYTFLEEICPLSELTQRSLAENLLDDPKGYGYNLEYTRKILDFCKEKGMEPVFYITPSVGRVSDEWGQRVREDLAEMGVKLIDFNDQFDELGLDMSVDFFDSFHLNCRGAEKFSRYLGDRLGEWAEASAPHDEGLWQGRIQHFYSMLEATIAAEPKYKDDSTAAIATANKEG